MFFLEQNQCNALCIVSYEYLGSSMNIKFLLFAGVASALALAGSAAQAGVVNGNFEAGNTGFGSGYGYLAPAGSGTLYPASVYTVVNDPNAVHNLFSSFGDHTSGSGLMMVVNGSGVGGTPVWFQNGLSVVTNTTYFFSTWVASAHPSSPAMLDFSVNGTSIGGLTASSTTGVWQQFYGTWFSGASTTADLALVNQNLASSGNDFALDDIDFGLTRPGVPEPTTWALMLMGFGAVGYAMRRQRAVALAA